MGAQPHATSNQCVVGVYEGSETAETAVRILHSAGFGPAHTSVVRRHFNPSGAVGDELKLGDDSLHDAAIGGAVGGAVGAVGAAALISVTGIGLILMTGPLVAITGAIVGAFLGAMRGWGIHDQHIREYEQQVDAGKILVVVTGEPPEVERAEHLLRQTQASHVRLHAVAADESGEVDDRPK